MRNPVTGEVRVGSGMIHAYGPHYRSQAVARKARAAIPEAPVHVRMREMRDAGATWGRLCAVFGFATEDGARKHLRAAEGKDCA